jgi:hypothetical protein
VAPHGEGEALRDRTSPAFNQPNVGVLVEGVVDFDEVEYFRVSFQRGLVWNLEVSPAARTNKAIRQQLTKPHEYYELSAD